jgi:tetratricopeptide (TPR) repeat protein
MGLGFVAVRTIVLVLLGGAVLTVTPLASNWFPSQVTEQHEYNLSNIRFQPDPRIFAVMVALNAAGFSEEISDETMSKAHVLFRKHTENLDPGIVARLEEFYESHKSTQTLGSKSPGAPYISLALLVRAPPDFRLGVATDDLPAEVRTVKGFEELVRELWVDHGVAELWLDSEFLYRREAESYRPIFETIIQETLAYFRVPFRVSLDKKIILIPALLDRQNIVNARNMEKTYYIVVGPTDDPNDNFWQLQHEYLHFLIDGIVQKFGAPLLRFDKLLSLSQAQPESRLYHKGQLILVVIESLIESIQLQLNDSESPEATQQKLVEAYRQGLILAPYFHRGLQRFTGDDEMSLPLFIEGLLGEVREKDAYKDGEWVIRVETAQGKKNAAIQEELQRAIQHNAFVTRFSEVSRLIQKKDNAGARALLLELVQSHPEKGSVHFYLGQLHAQADDHEAALESYLKCSQMQDAETWVVAWSRVRAGKILASMGEFKRAETIFEEAQMMGGDLRGAREEAQRLISRLP